MDEELSRQKILDQLAEVADLKVSAKKSLSKGIEDFSEDGEGNVVLTRAELESLLTTQPNINIYAFHSSGINNAGEHSSN